jgi:protein tyrosine phosphatase
MVFHESKDVAVIVMLTQTFEAGREKCAQYFPLDDEQVSMTLTEESAEDADLEQQPETMIEPVVVEESHAEETVSEESKKRIETTVTERKVKTAEAEEPAIVSRPVAQQIVTEKAPRESAEIVAAKMKVEMPSTIELYVPSQKSELEPMVTNQSSPVRMRTFKNMGKVTLLESTFDAKSRSEIRKLQLTIGSESKIVWHFLFAGWADYSKPEGNDREALLELIKLSASKSGPDNPRVVHCSAGVGRTGTFIALDYLLQELESGQLLQVADPETDPIFETVNLMREQRMMMVYNEMQMQFIYEVLREQTDIKLGKVYEQKYGSPGSQIAG